MNCMRIQCTNASDGGIYAVGVFPVPGLTTLPVMLFIFLFRLNPVAAMLTNYLCTPLNIASVPVFM
jgi:hypothetical protein